MEWPYHRGQSFKYKELEILTELLITIPGRLPGLNEYQAACRGHWASGAKMKSDAQQQCEYAMALAKRKKVYFETADIAIVWYEKNKRRDKDNISFGRKFIFDALQTMGILENDGWKQIRKITEKFEVDKSNPRIEILLRAVE